MEEDSSAECRLIIFEKKCLEVRFEWVQGGFLSEKKWNAVWYEESGGWRCQKQSGEYASVCEIEDSRRSKTVIGNFSSNFALEFMWLRLIRVWEGETCFTLPTFWLIVGVQARVCVCEWVSVCLLHPSVFFSSFFPLAFVLVNELFSGLSLFLFWKCVRFCFCFCCCLFLFVVCTCILCLLPCLTRCSFIDVLSVPLLWFLK